MPIGPPSYPPDPKSACTPASVPMLLTYWELCGSTGNDGTGRGPRLSAGRFGQPSSETPVAGRGADVVVLVVVVGFGVVLVVVPEAVVVVGAVVLIDVTGSACWNETGSARSEPDSANDATSATAPPAAADTSSPDRLIRRRPSPVPRG